MNKSETRSFPTKAEAISWSQQIESQMRLGENPIVQTNCDLTFGEVVERYITQVTSNKKGFREEGYRLRKLLEETICGKRLSSITSADIASLRDERLKKVSPSLVRRELVVIKHLFNIAMFEWGTGLTKNPVSKVRLPNCSPSRQRRVASDEICELVAAHSPLSTVPLKELILFALETGMRRSEILSIQPEFVDLDNALI